MSDNIKNTVIYVIFDSRYEITVKKNRLNHHNTADSTMKQYILLNKQ